MSADRMTPEQFAGIAARAEAATPGPWERLPESEGYGRVFVAYLQGEHLRGVGDFDFGEGEDAAADEAFTLHAREDVAALLAEVARLREFERRVTEELEEFEDAAKADPNTPRVARLMIAALQHAVKGGA